MPVRQDLLTSSRFYYTTNAATGRQKMQRPLPETPFFNCTQCVQLLDRSCAGDPHYLAAFTVLWMLYRY